MKRREFISGISAMAASAGVPGVEPSLASTRGWSFGTERMLLVIMADPEQTFGPGLVRHGGPEQARRVERLRELEALVLTAFNGDRSSWRDFYEVHVRLFRDGNEWMEADPFFPSSQLQHGRWEFVVRGVQLAYIKKMAPYRAAFTESILRGEHRLSREPLDLFARLTEAEARACGLLIPPHDEVGLIFMRLPGNPQCCGK